MRIVSRSEGELMRGDEAKQEKLFATYRRRSAAVPPSLWHVFRSSLRLEPRGGCRVSTVA